MADLWFAAWAWIEGLKGGAPQFLGSLMGSLFGLMSIVAGAVFNAHLNRRRDDRLRREEARSVIAAIRAELSSIENGFSKKAKLLETDKQSDFFVRDISQAVRLVPELRKQLGLLGEEVVGTVMNAVLLIDEYAERLLFLKGQVTDKLPSGRTMIRIPAAQSKNVVRLNQVTANEISKAIGALDGAAQKLKLGHVRITKPMVAPKLFP